MDLHVYQVKAHEMRAEWSRWLVAIATGICAALWDVLKTQQAGRVPHRGWVVAGWTCFALAALVAAALVSRVHGDMEAGRTTRSDAVRALGRAHLALFGAGVACVLVFVLARALASP